MDKVWLLTGTKGDIKSYNTHSDHLGSSSLVTGVSGDLLEQLDYFPYGELRLQDQKTDFDTQKKFTGKELDEESDLMYFGARYYDSRLARFISEDPVAQQAPLEILEDPQSMNFYAYARNNPMVYKDPDGKFMTPYHKKITKSALKNTGISKTNLGIIIDGNLTQDFPYIQSMNDNEKHFDNGKVKEGFEYIKSRYDYIKNLDPKTKMFNYNAYFAFGNILHATQDFYAHSNYVELYLEYYEVNNNFKQPKPGEIPLYEDAIKDGQFTGWMKEQNKQLTTGCWTDPCTGEFTHDQLNKDAPWRTNYEYAENLAERQTKKEYEKFKAIMDEKKS